MSDLPVLRRLHRLWMVFAATMVVILLALPFLSTEPSDLPAVLPATLAVAGVGGAFLALVAIDLTFAASPPANDQRALAEFEARVTLGFVIAQAPAILGFILTVVFGMLASAVIGGVGGALCLWRARPTLQRLERIEQAWRNAGSSVSALRAATTPDPTSPQLDPRTEPDTDLDLDLAESDRTDDSDRSP